MILNKKELTLGHTYHYEHGSINEVRKFTLMDMSRFTDSPERYAGVPLSADILTDSLGFKEQSDYHSRLDLDNGFCLIACYGYKDVAHVILTDISDNELRVIRTVHEVQNLYYDLTGEDLEFKTVKG